MSNFKFSLENVLDYRQNIEDKKKEILAGALKKVKEEEHQLEKLINQKKQQLSNNNRGLLKPVELRQQQAYIQLLEDRIKRQQSRVKEAKNRVQKCTQEWSKSATDRKMLENIKDKQLAEYSFMLAKTEQKILDETGLAWFNRKV